jgi:hypothetical protein
MRGGFLMDVIVAAAAFGLVVMTETQADDIPVFKLRFSDGAITPLRLVVPAGSPFKIELENAGTSPIEFESRDLHKEKVVGPGVTSSIVFRRLAAGEYVFFDDFHVDAPQAVLVAE